MRKTICRLARSRAKVLPGAKNTTKQAVYLPVSKVFSCPKFKVLDVGRVYPQGWPHNLFCVLKPHVHSADLRSQRVVFQSRQGAETMTTTTPKAAPLGTTPAITSNTTLGRLLHTRIIQRRYPALTAPKVEPTIARQQAIENALSMALHYIRTTDTQQGIQAATAKAMRAVSMLKQACNELTIGGVTA